MLAGRIPGIPVADSLDRYCCVVILVACTFLSWKFLIIVKLCEAVMLLACRMLGTPFAADLESRHCFAVLPGGRTVVCCGYWDNSIRCYTTDDGRRLQSLRQHKDIVTCVAAGADSRTIVSGSRDTTLVIWDAVPPSRGGKSKQKGPVSLVLRERPRHVLYGHSDAVVCLAVCTELDLVVSASADGSVLFHTLLEGR